MKTPITLSVPFALIVDLVNHSYVFAGAIADVEPALAADFKITRKMAECGSWWRLVYGVLFHGAIHQIAAKALAQQDAPASNFTLTETEAQEHLPYYAIVQTLLGIWRDPTRQEAEKKQAIAMMFPADVAMHILPPSNCTSKSQFYEEIEEQAGRGMGDFFTYLAHCPLPGNGAALPTLAQAIAYWGWLDNVKAFRTFCKEESAKNLKLKRMQQAVAFYRLVQLFQERTGLALGIIHLHLSEQQARYLAAVDLAWLALLADSLGRDPIFDYCQAGVFLRRQTFGDVLRDLKQILGASTSQSMTSHHAALILRAVVRNIENHERLLERNATPVPVINTQLRALANDLVGASPGAELPLAKVAAFANTLHSAKRMTDVIAQQDFASCHASVGIDLLLNLANSNHERILD